MTAIPTARPKPAPFVPQSFDGTHWGQIEPLLRALLERPVRSRAELERWLIDRGELEAACGEARAMLYIAMTCDTEDKATQQAYSAYIEDVPPKFKPLSFELDKRQVAMTKEHRLVEAPERGDRFMVLARDTEADVALFRPENVPLETELTLLAQKFDQTVGAMTAVFDGREQTFPQMARYAESTDRAVREGAWRAVSERRLKDADTVDAIFDEMLGLRHKVARNAGFDDYIGYTFKSKHRFDYGPKECFDFHAGCEKAVVPLIRRLDEQRKRALKVDALRPWDLAVDIKGRAPLRPFSGGVDLVNKSRVVFDRLDPRLGEMFRSLGDGANARGPVDGACLDLDSRKGKAPGGYQYMLDRSRRPFIFMNAAGMQHDVSTMLHEAGHAFHSMLCIDEPLLAYRASPMEFAEVASMSMEMITLNHWGDPGAYYADEVQLARARRHQIESAVSVLPWIATIDAFQHWIYANPTHTRDQRRAFWLTLDDRFGHAVDWRGLETARANHWHRQKHIFDYPFYYIEYGIAQLGALGLWLISLEQGEKKAVELYTRALSLGGSRPLPDLFAAAGLKFDFGPGTVSRLVERVERELEKLPE